MKERLLGAAVLIVIAVLVIPSLLDGPRSPDTVSEELTLPAPTPGQNEATPEPLRTHTVEVETRKTPAEDETLPVAAVEKALPTVPAPPASQETELEPPVPDAAPAAVPAPAAIPAPADSWAVQVGSFTSESNARRLVEHLKGAKYPAFVVRNVVNGRVMFRVRVGPEPDRSRAEALAERLQADRQQTQLVRHP